MPFDRTCWRRSSLSYFLAPSGAVDLGDEDSPDSPSSTRSCGPIPRRKRRFFRMTMTGRDDDEIISRAELGGIEAILDRGPTPTSTR